MRKILFPTILVTLIGCGQPDKSGLDNGMTATPSGLQYQIVKEGRGAPAEVGDEVLIHETMSYQSDSLLFSSYTFPNPVKILIGGNQAIEGVDEALRGMKVGEVRKAIIPPSLSKRYGPEPQTFPHLDSTLVYEIELVEILGHE